MQTAVEITAATIASGIPFPTTMASIAPLTALILILTASAYSFAKNLQAKLNVPVGVLNTPIGGTVIEGWIPRDGIEGDASLIKEFDTTDDSVTYIRIIASADTEAELEAMGY